MPRVAAQPSVDLQGALKAALVKIKEADKKDALIAKLQDQVTKLKGGAAAAPAKRGRPAKASAAVDVPVSKRVKAADVTDAPKRRGRPPKAEAAPVASEAPKRRGRPPKAEAAAAAPAKKVAAKPAAAPAKAKRSSDDDYLL